MKKFIVVAVGLAVRIGLGAVEVGGLPAWEFADTEVATDVPFAFPQANVKHFFLSMELAGTPSNNVQVAFGRDANTNGVLEVCETGFAVGWDCGAWVLRDRGTNEWCAASVTTNAKKSLAFDLGVARAKPRRVFATENGEVLAWDVPERLPRGLYCNEWDTLRLTVRGIDPPEESIRAQVVVEGFKLMVK